MVKSVAKIFKGDGTLESPYLIETTEDMVKLADFIDLTSFDYSGFCFRPVNDLDFKGADWKIIVPNTTRFNASFDGNGKTISGYRFENLDNATGVGRFVGSFGVVGQSGAIRNLTVAGSFSTRQYAGGIAGDLYGVIDNCINRSTVNTTEGGSGGIVSRAFTGSTVSNCRNEGTVSGKGTVNGGIVANGQPDATEVTDCHNEADIVLSNTINGQYAAGIIGRTYMLNNVGSSTVISGCTNSGRIVAKGNSGGIVGALNMGATVRECVNTGTIVNTGAAYAGGILGNSLGATWVYDCVNHGKIEAHWQYAGGVAGLVCTGMTVYNCYNDGEVTMTATPGINYAFANTIAIGGFAGSIRGNVSNSWNSGNVTSDYVAVGGLCGILSGENADGTPNVLNCFNTGDIHAKGQLAGANTAADGKSYRTKFYNLDAILSVGYRVNSRNATLFRQWANKVLKEYLLRGYSINQRLMHIENRIDHRLSEHDIQIKELSNRMDFFVRTSLPPREGIIFDGQIFDAYTLMCDLIRSARTRIIMVDNYIDDSVFLQLDKRAHGVSATIFTPSVSRVLRQDLERHNAQYAPIEVRTFRRAHDRFLIIDDTVYHVGASFKDLGKKLTAFSKMEIMTADEFIAYLGA